MIIIYQTDRKHEDCDFYYPEDEKTPIKRVQWVKNLKDEDVNKMYITACPYILEALCKRFNGKTTNDLFLIDGKESTLEDIFTLFAEPMQQFLK